MKVVQRLVLIGANIQATDSKGKMAKNITENQKIVFLLEKYEKLQKIASQLKDESSDSELEEEEQEQWLDQSEPVILETKSASLKPQIKQKMQEKKRKQSSYFIEEIDEENLMDELESGDTGSILEQAQKFCTDFQSVEIVPRTEGLLILKKGNGLLVKSSLRYFQLLSTQGVLVKYREKENCTEL